MKEFSITACLSTILSFVGYHIGGWDSALKLLIALMIIDFITGFLGAWLSGNVSSKQMSRGGIKKGTTMLVIYVATLLDQMIGGDAAVFRLLTIYFYISTEFVSLTENLGKLGVPLPPALTKAILQLKERNGKDENTKSKKSG